MYLMPLALEVAPGRREELAIDSSDYPTRDGTCVRDYSHVMDLVEAQRAAAERAGDELGWQPAASNREAIIGSASEWYRVHPNGYAS